MNNNHIFLISIIALFGGAYGMKQNFNNFEKEKATNQINYFDLLPDEMINHIFCFLMELKEVDNLDFYFRYDTDGISQIQDYKSFINTCKKFARIGSAPYRNWKNKNILATQSITAVKENLVDWCKKYMHPNDILHEAAKYNSVALLKFIFDSGVNLDKEDEFLGETALYTAIRNKAIEATKFLIYHGVKINPIHNVWGSPLHHAALSGNSVKIVSYLIGNGANINVADEFGATPLHFAAESNSTKLTQILINNGANINAQDKDGRTPLHYAATNYAKATLLLLINNSADINIKSQSGQTAVDEAKQYWNKKSVIKFASQNKKSEIKDKHCIIQ